MNGSAFPMAPGAMTQGLSKREYFAAMAMSALITKKSIPSTEELTKRAYEYADQMIQRGD
jgi:hypothetical protein